MKTLPNPWLMRAGVCSLALVFLWLFRVFLTPLPRPLPDVSALLTIPPGTSGVVDPVRAQGLDKPSGMVQAAKAAQANARSPQEVSASRDAAARHSQAIARHDHHRLGAKRYAHRRRFQWCRRLRFGWPAGIHDRCQQHHGSVRGLRFG